MSGSSIPSTFLKNVLQNGVGRHICQLQRLTLCFCKTRVCSFGMREFIENHLLDFTRKNPGIVVYLKPRRHRKPVLYAEYLNGNRETFSVENQSKEEISKWIEYMRTRSGAQIQRLRKPWHTENPSIQGVWHPFSNKDPALNLVTFPDKKLGENIRTSLSATEILAKMNEPKLE